MIKYQLWQKSLDANLFSSSSLAISANLYNLTYLKSPKLSLNQLFIVCDRQSLPINTVEEGHNQVAQARNATITVNTIIKSLNFKLGHGRWSRKPHLELAAHNIGERFLPTTWPKTPRLFQVQQDHSRTKPVTKTFPNFTAHSYITWA